MGYTGHVHYTVDGKSNTINEWKHDNTEDAMRYAEAIQLVRGADMTIDYCNKAEGSVYSSISYDTFNSGNGEVEDLHLMAGMLHDALERDYNYRIVYENDTGNYRVKYTMPDSEHEFNFATIDAKTFDKFAEVFSKVDGKSVAEYEKLTHKEGFSMSGDKLHKAFRPVILELTEKHFANNIELKNAVKELDMLDTARSELDKGNKVFMCARASQNGVKNIVLRIDDHGKKSVKAFPYNEKNMTIYSLGVSGEWAGNYEKIDKKKDADLLIQANRLVGKSRPYYSSIVKKVAKELEAGKEASIDIGGSY